MPITESLEKRQLVVVLAGIDGSPAEYYFNAVRFLRNDDGSDAAPPQNVRIDATADEAKQLLGDKVPALMKDVAEQGARAAELLVERDAAVKLVGERDAEIVSLQNRLVAAATSLSSLRGSADAALQSLASPPPA